MSLISRGGCGLACLARRQPSRNSYYVCTGKTRAARHRNGATCESRYIPSQAIDDLVWQDLCDLLRHPAAVAEAFRLASVGAWHPQEFQARRDRLRQGKASLAQQLERLTEAYPSGASQQLQVPGDLLAPPHAQVTPHHDHLLRCVPLGRFHRRPRHAP